MNTTILMVCKTISRSKHSKYDFNLHRRNLNPNALLAYINARCTLQNNKHSHTRVAITIGISNYYHGP